VRLGEAIRYCNVRVTLDLLGLAKVCLVNTVDGSEGDALLLEGGSGFLVMRSEGFAVAAPEINEIREEIRCGQQLCTRGRKIPQASGGCC
jgi:hypothetical protein